VVATHHLVEPIAQSLQEVLVGVQHLALEVELDVGVVLVERAQDAAAFWRSISAGGDVVAHARGTSRLAVVTQHGRDDGVHVVGRAVLGAVLDDAAEDLAAADGGPQLLEHLLGHVGVARGAVRCADQLVAAVPGDLDELVVDADDVALLVGLGDDAGDVHDVGAHLAARLGIGQPLAQRGSSCSASWRAASLASTRDCASRRVALASSRASQDV
jgi:hypothetical protein